MTTTTGAGGARGRAFSKTTVTAARAAIAVIGPAVLLAGFAYHPLLPDTQPETVGAAASADTTRWAIAHFTVGVGFGLVALAFLAVRSYLREAGEGRWSALGVPFVVMGSVVLAFLPAFEMGPLAAIRTGGDPAALQLTMDAWFVPTMLAGSVLFAIGAISFAVGIVKSGVLSSGTAWLVAAALLVMSVARIPGPYTFIVWGLAGVVAFWPLAYAMWARPAPERARTRATAAA